MRLPQQIISLLTAARQLSKDLKTDAVLLLTETRLNWDEVREHLGPTRLLVAAQDENLLADLHGKEDCIVLRLDSSEPMPLQERMSVALLNAIANEQIRPGSHVIVLYNGIDFERSPAEPIDSLSIMHLDEHLETLRPSELRRLNTHVPLDTLRLVVDLATEIGREGREGQPVGTIFVVGDTRKVLQMCRPVNFNPFRGYSRAERDLHDRRVREQIKEIAQLDGAIIISRDAIAEAACMYIDAPAEDLPLSKGLASRHIAAAAISRATQAVAVAVSQSSGTVRLFLRGEVVMHIEPLARPQIWQPFRVETADDDGRPRLESRPRTTTENR